MSKTFTYAGVSRLNGQFKARFATDALRTKVLIKTGHTDIDLVELKHPMTKEEAVAYLISIDFDNGNAEVRAALEDKLAKMAPKEPKAPREKKVKAEKPTLEKIRAKKTDEPVLTTETVAAQLDELEDAPF